MLKRMKHKRLFYLLIFLVGGFLLLQVLNLIIPGLQPTNPPVTYTTQWNPPSAGDLWRSACQDCHSNESHWPWYARIAPASWLVLYDVHQGRNAFNISEGRRPETAEIIEVLLEGEMPPFQYKLIHTDASLSDAERRELADGMVTTWGGSYPAGEGEGGDD